jgi:hypothetical protein
MVVIEFRYISPGPPDSEDRAAVVAAIRMTGADGLEGVRAVELGGVNLADALELAVLIALRDYGRGRRTGSRWLQSMFSGRS